MSDEKSWDQIAIGNVRSGSALVIREPEAGVEVEFGTSHEINADCPGLGCIEDGAAHDPDEDEEPGDATCQPCGTSDGCNKHKIFTCATCKRLTHWRDGAADDCPDDCSDCWAAKHPDAADVPVIVRVDDPAPVDEIGGEA